MTTTFVDVDVRPVLRAGGEPFSQIMAALEALEPGQGLRLFATFKPIPLFGVMASKGFANEALELEDGEWQVEFRPLQDAATETSLAPRSETAAWPRPVLELDTRDLDPPEPMARVLQAVEALRAGEVVSALLPREPVFLFPELARRGHQWRGGFEPDATSYRILVRAGAAKGPTA
jgi:uncharacterized protein (DUF2249 family)